MNMVFNLGKVAGQGCSIESWQLFEGIVPLYSSKNDFKDQFCTLDINIKKS